VRVTVIGCGYVGLTTAIALAYLENDVICLDTDQGKVEELQCGKVPFYEPGLDDLFKSVRDNLGFTSSYEEAVPAAEALIIAVGTPPSQDGGADLGQLRQAVRCIADNVGRRCRVVAIKSTVPPGTGRFVREWLARSNPKLAVASNPEFLRVSYALLDSFYPDRIVIGTEDERGIHALSQLYQPLLEQSFDPPHGLPRPEGTKAVPLVVTELVTAELIKYAANAFLATKISFINEMAGLAEQIGADIGDVATGIGLDARIGTQFLKAGIGWGGSCLGKDTSALLKVAEGYGIELPITAAARRVNAQRRQAVTEVLQRRLRDLDGRTVTLLGLAFKPHTDDLRDAPALDIIRNLCNRGARVKVHDPAAVSRAREECPNIGAGYFDDVMEAVRAADALVIVTDWPEYRSLPWTEVRGSMKGNLIYDGRNFLDRSAVEAAGFQYIGVGRLPLPHKSKVPVELKTAGAEDGGGPSTRSGRSAVEP